MNRCTIPDPPADEAETPEAIAFREYMRRDYVPRVPHCAALGMSVDEITRVGARLRLPCRPEFVGDPARKLIHNGVLAVLIDSACGCAVCARIGRSQRIATLDLRVDYLRSATLGADLLCEAECFRMTSNIAFVRAQLWQLGTPEQPVAQAVAVFMRSNSVGRSVL